MDSHRSILATAIVGIAITMGSTLNGAPPKEIRGASATRYAPGQQVCLVINRNAMEKLMYYLQLDQAGTLEIRRTRREEATSNIVEDKVIHSYPRPKGAIDYLMFDDDGNFYYRLKDGGTANPFTGQSSDPQQDRVVRGGPGARVTLSTDGEPHMVLVTAQGETKTK